MNRTKPQPPDHLSAEAKAWWAIVAGSYDLENHHVRLLTSAAEAWDRCQQARTAIQTHGLTYDDKHGQPKARPEIAIERDSRIAFARMIRELDLDDAPLPDPRLPRRK